MKRIFYIFLFLSFVVVYAQNTTDVGNKNIFIEQPYETKKAVDMNEDLSKYLSQTNNILTCLEVFIGILALIGAIVGIISWRFVSKFNSRINEIKKNIENAKRQNAYLGKSSECLYEALADFIAKPKNTLLTARLLLKIEESKLFSLDDTKRLSALLYFGQQGTKEHLDSLILLAENDDSNQVRKKANEVIGIIKYKYS